MAEIDMPVLGMLRRRDSLATPSRHLGLVPAAERVASAQAVVAELGAAVAAGVELDAVLALAASAPDLPADPWDPAAAVAPGAAPSSPRPVVAVADGPAFTFGYAETAELLTAAGAEVARFDPTVDEALPDAAAGLVIGGGFPQVHAGALTANAALRARVRAFAAAGGPIAAECAGLLYLASALDGAPMCGVLGEVTAAMTPRLTLGYRDAAAATDSVLATRGTPVHGHEFHRTAVAPRAGGADPDAPAAAPVATSRRAASAAGRTAGAPAWRWRDARGDEVAEGFVHGRIHASYLHTHWAGLSGAATRFVEAARVARVELRRAAG
jgi:cobyrinic acid a,c-diamide synthase